MHVRFARYTIEGDTHEIVRRAEAGMLPIFESQDGFRAYSIAGTDNEIFSFSVWDTPEQADAANEAAAGWVADNLADHLTLVEAAFAELLLSTTLNVSPARV